MVMLIILLAASFAGCFGNEGNDPPETQEPVLATENVWTVTLDASPTSTYISVPYGKVGLMGNGTFTLVDIASGSDTEHGLTTDVPDYAMLFMRAGSPYLVGANGTHLMGVDVTGDAIEWTAAYEEGIPDLIAHGDVNGDGAIEVIYSEGPLMFALDPSTGDVLWGENTTLPVQHVQVSDLSSSGRPTIMALTNSTLTLFDGMTGLETHNTSLVNITNGTIEDLLTVDLDNDGVQEILILDSNSIHVLEANGTYRELAYVFTGTTVWHRQADDDMDGYPDLVYSTGTTIVTVNLSDPSEVYTLDSDLSPMEVGLFSNVYLGGYLVGHCDGYAWISVNGTTTYVTDLDRCITATTVDPETDHVVIICDRDGEVSRLRLTYRYEE